MGRVAKLTVTEQIDIAAPPATVWDYTQDWTRRSGWDPAITSAEVLQEHPPVVRARGRGRTSFTARYKLSKRPVRTSLQMTDCVPTWLGGGGSWAYEACDGGTRWTQTNTLTIAGRLRGRLLGWLLRWQLRRVTRIAMRNAKRAIDGGGRGPAPGPPPVG